MTARQVQVTIPAMNGKEARTITVTIRPAATRHEGYLTPIDRDHEDAEKGGEA